MLVSVSAERSWFTARAVPTRLPSITNSFIWTMSAGLPNALSSCTAWPARTSVERLSSG